MIRWCFSYFVIYKILVLSHGGCIAKFAQSPQYVYPYLYRTENKCVMD